MPWFNRVVLGASVALFGSIALRTIADPVGAEAPHHITLGSPEAITNTRISGAVFLALALLLSATALSRARHVSGLWLLVTVSGVLTTFRIVGLVVDGPAPFTLFVLKPELAITALSAAALVLERRRLKAVHSSST